MAMSENAEPLLPKFKLLPHSQAAGISSSTGEKLLPATWSSLIKSSLQQTGPASGRWRQQWLWLSFWERGQADHDTGEEHLNKAL